MALAFLEALRHSMLDEITALIDADAADGELRILDGSRPATGGAQTTLLATLDLGYVFAAGASGGDLTANSISDDTSAAATGTATWFRITDSSGDFIMDGDVGTSGSDLNLNSVAITIGGTVSVTSFVITAGNA